MPALDFKEIAPAHQGSERDQFELFARDVLKAYGFLIVRDPDRGPDAGRDIIVRDTRVGLAGITTVDFLVSCKHKAHSGSAVSESDEQNIRDKMGTHGCTGFIAFYSTVPSSTLGTHLTELKKISEVQIFDPEKIETFLLSSPQGRVVAARYFPVSFPKWVTSSQYAEVPHGPKPLAIGDKYFLRPPHSSLDDAIAEAAARHVPVFAVVYDAEHSKQSRMAHGLGHYTDWESTKRLIDLHFVAAVGPSSDPKFGALVPKDDPLEVCWLSVFDEGGEYLSERVHANPGTGRQQVSDIIKRHSERTSGMLECGSTETLGEIDKMGAPIKQKADVSLGFMTETNEPLPHGFARVFENYPEDLPDMVRQRAAFSSPILQENRDYFRDFATFFEARDRMILSRVVLTNRSEFSLGDVHIEVVISCPAGAHVDLYRADDVPEEPSDTAFPVVHGLHEARRKMTIDDQGPVPTAYIGLGNVRPGQVVRAEEDLAIVPSAPGQYCIQARIFANDIPTPILIEHQVEVTGEVVEVSREELIEWIRNY